MKISGGILEFFKMDRSGLRHKMSCALERLLYVHEPMVSAFAHGFFFMDIDL